MLKVFEEKVPLDIEAPSSDNIRNPQLELASSLLDIIKQPLVFAKQLMKYQQSPVGDKISDNEKISQSKTIELILNHFCSDILSHTTTHQLYYYILPMLSRSTDLPKNELISFVEKLVVSKGSRQMRDIYLFSSLVLLVKPSFGTFDTFFVNKLTRSLLNSFLLLFSEMLNKYGKRNCLKIIFLTFLPTPM